MRKTLLWLYSLITAILLAYAGGRVFVMDRQLVGAELRLLELRRSYELIRAENDLLTERISRSGGEDTLAAIARDKLGFVLPEDRIYIIDSELQAAD